MVMSCRFECLVKHSTMHYKAKHFYYKKFNLKHWNVSYFLARRHQLLHSMSRGSRGSQTMHRFTCSLSLSTFCFLAMQKSFSINLAVRNSLRRVVTVKCGNDGELFVKVKDQEEVVTETAVRTKQLQFEASRITRPHLRLPNLQISSYGPDSAVGPGNSIKIRPEHSSCYRQICNICHLYAVNPVTRMALSPLLVSFAKA